MIFKKDPHVSIIMPAYNAQEHLAATIDRIPSRLWSMINVLWIINDGSTDSTAAVADALAKKHEKIRPIHCYPNRGYGAVMKKGLDLCKGDGCMVAVCLHSDGQYSPEAIGEGLLSMRNRKLDVMQGSRIASGTALSGGMPLYKFIANRALTFLENMVYGLSLTDYHSGMLFYGRTALDTLPFKRFSDSFDFDVEVIACCRALDLSVGEMPVPTHYGTEVSHVRSIRYGLRVVKVMIKYLLRRYSNP
jgi:glycosyltransferase involved in cell wall biosynthesis